MRSLIFTAATLLTLAVSEVASADPGRATPSLEALVNDAQRDDRSQCHRPLRGNAITLPADDAAHPYTPDSIEWWYWTSHLIANDGRAFGFLDIVYTSLLEVAPGEFQPVQWSDTTVSDLSDNSYRYGGRELRALDRRQGEATAVGYADGSSTARGVVELTWFCGF